jgi:hypothetical protein
MSARQLILAILVGGMLLAEWGCNRPNFARAGSSTYQRLQANLHDPYPDASLGPEVTGGRPREFQKPLAEPVRNTISQPENPWLTRSWWNR